MKGEKQQASTASKSVSHKARLSSHAFNATELLPSASGRPFLPAHNGLCIMNNSAASLNIPFVKKKYTFSYFKEEYLLQK